MVQVIRTGATRIVLLTRRYAFKIPNFLTTWGHKWRMGLTGLLANQQEWRMWSFCRYPELCPVVFYLPLGFLVVMPRVEILTADEYAGMSYRTLTGGDSYVLPSEDKPNSFGWLDGRVVCIDYGNW